MSFGDDIQPVVDLALENGTSVDEVSQVMFDMLQRLCPDGIPIYTVKGSTGEYSDFCTWTVKSFLNKEEAEKFANLCQEEVDLIILEYGREGTFGDYRYVSYEDVKRHQYDPNCRIDYTGTSYSISKSVLK